MKVSDIVERIENRYPLEAALSFDNVGLLVGSMHAEVSRVYIAVDATQAVIEAAKEAKAELLLLHHPIIFSPIQRITDQVALGRNLIELMKNNIACYALHTNYDVLRMGELVSTMMQKGAYHFTREEVLELSYEDEKGIGVIGELEEVISLQECCAWVKESFSIPSVKVFGILDREIRRVAISPGSGKSMIPVAVEKQADVLITGDIGHHEGLDALEEGLTIIDASHFGLEQVFVEDMAAFFKDQAPTIDCICAVDHIPFQIL